MILCKHGEEYQHGDRIFVIGTRVYGLIGSAYSGLVGTITEIRTEADKETENPEADIYVDFMLPVLQKDRQELVKRFSALHGQPIDLACINLDTVIMSPRSVAPIREQRNKQIEIPAYLLQESWANDDACGSYIWVFSYRADAEQKMSALLAEENANGLLAKWKDDGDFVVSEQEDRYECWLDGRYCEAHYSLSITAKTIHLSSNMTMDIYNAQIAANRREDFFEEICQWEETEGLTEQQYLQLLSNPDIPKRIQEKLATNASYWDAYYQSLSKACSEIVEEYIEGLSETDSTSTES